MPGLAQIRDGLKVRLATISGLNTHDTVPSQLTPPAAVVGGIERIEYDEAFQRSGDRWLIPVRVYVGRADDRSAQDALDSYLASDGATSVKAAIEGDVTLGGVVDTLRVTEARGYGSYAVAGVDYLGCEWLVEVLD